MSINVLEMGTEISAGSVERIRTLMKDPEAVQLAGQHSWLFLAASLGRIDVVKVLLHAGCDPNFKVKYGTRALNGALLENNLEMATLLLEHGADPNLERYVVSAVVGGKANALAMLKLLERFGADLHREFPLGKSDKTVTALDMARTWNQQEAVEYLMANASTEEVTPRETNLTLTATSTANPPLADEIITYFEANSGHVQPEHLTEIVPTTDPSITIHLIRATPERNYTTLFTTGMSSREMMVAPGGDTDFRFGELFIELEGDWPIGSTALSEPDAAWPIRCLRSMASYPHNTGTDLGPVAITSNGNPPQPIAPSWPFTAMLLLAETHFVSKDGRLIQLYRLTPLYREEFELHMRSGISALMRLFDARNVPFIASIHRKNVALKG